jgi:hypothetical protein
MTNEEIRKARGMIDHIGDPQGYYAETVMKTLRRALDDLEQSNLQVGELQNALENAAYSMQTDECRGEHEECMRCQQIRFFLTKAGRPLKREGIRQSDLMENCVACGSAKLPGLMCPRCFGARA